MDHAEIAALFRGRSGQEDAEDQMSAAKGDDYVTVASDTSMVFKLLGRLPPAAVLNAEVMIAGGAPSAVFKIDRRYFRGFEYAFRSTAKGEGRGRFKRQEEQDE